MCKERSFDHLSFMSCMIEGGGLNETKDIRIRTTYGVR